MQPSSERTAFPGAKDEFKIVFNYFSIIFHCYNKVAAISPGSLTVSHRNQISFMPSATGISNLMLNF